MRQLAVWAERVLARMAIGRTVAGQNFWHDLSLVSLVIIANCPAPSIRSVLPQGRRTK